MCIFCSQENKGREEEREAGQNPKVPARKKRYAKHAPHGTCKTIASEENSSYQYNLSLIVIDDESVSHCIYSDHY